MKYILTPDQMRAADAAATNEYGIPSIVLMENAARNAADAIRRIIHQALPGFRHTVRILCGAGNNGGDGLAIARHLCKDFQVAVVVLRVSGQPSHENETNLRIVKALQERIMLECTILDDPLKCSDPFFRPDDVIIEALVGIGGSEELRDCAQTLLQQFMFWKGALHIAIDCPAGLNCLTGAASRWVFPADYTITMAAEKTGMFLYEGPVSCGKIETVDIGAPEMLIASGIRRFERDDIPRMIRKRYRVSSKFDYGRLVIIAGSRPMPGAAALAANAAITAGAGLVELFTPERHAAILPEIICRETAAAKNGFFTPDDLDAVLESLEKADAVVIGPGMGARPETAEFIRAVLAKFRRWKPLIVDADALDAVKGAELRESVILTPHIGEFARLTGISRKDIDRNSLEIARTFASKTGAILHLKHAPSITTNGGAAYFTTNGNPGMATAGSGDVLTGIIGAFAARRKADSEKAEFTDGLGVAAFAAFVHAEAGDEYARKYGQETLTASRIIEMLPTVLDGGKR